MQDSNERFYFSCRGNMLDFKTGKQRWFGAVWSYEEGERHPVTYWFADTEEEVCLLWRQSGWHEKCTFLFMPYPIQHVYDEVRKMQSDDDAQ